jgi:hypothetical protein
MHSKLELPLVSSDEHFEVWDRNSNWLGVANLDGSKNIAKTDAVRNPSGN